MDGRRLVLALGTVVLCAGCSITTHGRSFKAGGVKDLTVGQTTREQAKRLVGRPLLRIVDPATGRELWRYARGNTETRFTLVLVQFGSNDLNMEDLTLEFNGDALSRVEYRAGLGKHEGQPVELTRGLPILDPQQEPPRRYSTRSQ